MQRDARIGRIKAGVGCSDEIAYVLMDYENLLTEVVHLAECETVKKGDMWTAEEDALIVDAVVTLGQKWQQISARVPGRSANAVRNRFLRCCSADVDSSSPLSEAAAAAAAAAALTGRKRGRDVNGAAHQRMAMIALQQEG